MRHLSLALLLLALLVSPAFALDVDTDDNNATDVAYGGTNANNASEARTNLGLGAAATKDTGAVADNATTVTTGNDVYDFCETTQAYVQTSSNNDNLDDLSDDNVNALANSTSAMLADMLTDESGSGLAIFGTGPTLTGFTLAGDLTVSGARDVDLEDNSTSALSWDASGKAGILALHTNDGSEKVSMSGDCEVSGQVSGGSIETDRTATPSVIFRDSDCTDSDDNAKIIGQCTATGSGAENCDQRFYVQRTGTETMMLQLDGDGGTQLKQPIGADDMGDDQYGATEALYGLSAGENVSQWDAVFLNSADSEWHQADANATNEFPARGIAVACSDGAWPCNDGDGLTVMTRGVIRNDGWAWGTVGGTLYLSTTAGGMTQTQPNGTVGNCLQKLGWAISDDEAYINASGDWSEAQ
jgi:hypothetical protein